MVMVSGCMAAVGTGADDRLHLSDLSNKVSDDRHAVQWQLGNTLTLCSHWLRALKNLLLLVFFLSFFSCLLSFLLCSLLIFFPFLHLSLFPILPPLSACSVAPSAGSEDFSPSSTDSPPDLASPSALPSSFSSSSPPPASLSSFPSWILSSPSLPLSSPPSLPLSSLLPLSPSHLLPLSPSPLLPLSPSPPPSCPSFLPSGTQLCRCERASVG
ncbi:hypothetical protein F7725_012050 [Dissostichus mawsoni]|uniref:Uncharacterized protein n=1 Tax=Dissostichus mawsoni TaxID=36200 RepID=A0A7J5ZCT9_DISMA|nr:hypothetical protein F7725_012050 [Dissostichus mawsoni]